MLMEGKREKMLLPKNEPSKKWSEYHGQIRNGGQAMPKTGANIYKRKDGRYEGRILLGKTVYQKPKYAYVYGKTLREVKSKMEKLREKETAARRQDWPDMRRAAEEWLQRKESQWKPTTYDVYRRMIQQYIDPILGSYIISDVSRNVLETFSVEMIRLSKTGALSQKYRKYVCAIVCRIIEYASDAYGIELEIPQIPDFKISSEEQELPDEKVLNRLEEYLTEHLEDDTCLGILLARYTGIRIGELCALQWRDIDLEKGMVMIRRNLQRIRNYENAGEGKTRLCMQKPKTLRSVRSVPLADGLIKILREYEGAPEKYLISGKRAEWAEIRTVQYRFAAILKKCGLEQFHFHLLRHAFASQCICAGCDMKSLSELLGHSSVQITMNIYVHSSVKQKKELVNHVCRL